MAGPDSKSRNGHGGSGEPGDVSITVFASLFILAIFLIVALLT
jgi:hypothetical protein